MNNYDPKFVSQFGKHIRNLRKQRGLTQLDISAMTNIPRTQIGRIERGQVNTTITTFKVIAQALDIPLRDFFDFEQL